MVAFAKTVPSVHLPMLKNDWFPAGKLPEYVPPSWVPFKNNLVSFVPYLTTVALYHTPCESTEPLIVV